MIPLWQFPREFCCIQQIRQLLDAHRVPHHPDRPPEGVGFPARFNDVQNGRVGNRDYDGSSQMFVLTGVAQTPENGLSYWRSSEVIAWILAQ